MCYIFSEFSVGIPIENEKGEVLGSSTLVPWYAIPQVVLSRVGMAVPNMGTFVVHKASLQIRVQIEPMSWDFPII